MKFSTTPKIGIVIAITLLLLLSSIGTESIQPNDSVLTEKFAIQQPTPPEINKFIDPVVRTNLAESNSTQSVSIKMTHELNLEEIQEIESQGVTFHRRGGSIVHAGQIYLAEIGNTEAFDALSIMDYVEQLQADCTTNELLLDTSIDEMGANGVYNLTDPVNDDYNITGEGITVAVIDSGIDWQHPDFYFADGGSYVYRNDGVEGAYIDLDDDSTYDIGEKAYYYDLTGDGGSGSVIDSQFDWLISDTNDNAAYDYGIDFMFLVNDTDLNEILDFGEYCIKLGTSKIQQIWDQTTGDFFVRGVNLTNTVLNAHVDTNGHGTHVAGTVAGGQVGLRAFTGVAPDAELLIVKTTFATLDIIDSVIWAVNEGADVITMSIGGYIFTPLDGSTNFEQTFDWAVDQGVPCTISAGNSANDDAHSLFTIPATTESSETFSVLSSGQEEVLLTALWMNSTNDITLQVQSPSSSTTSIPLGGTVVNVNNNIVSATRYTSPRGTAYINIYITYTAPRSGVETGDWELYFDNTDASGQEIHTYIYPSGDNEMADYLDTSYTIGSPSTADKVISVASYVTKTGYASPTLDDI
ncbi:MAG: S8 family serine peptidase, partial [Candidatus Thorarchaeota archaeon]